jgi:hypothetical protein
MLAKRLVMPDDYGNLLSSKISNDKIQMSNGGWGRLIKNRKSTYLWYLCVDFGI